jgi:hypothetical protein
VGVECGTSCPLSGARILRWLLDFWKIFTHLAAAEIAAEGSINYPCYTCYICLYNGGHDESGWVCSLAYLKVILPSNWVSVI